MATKQIFCPFCGATQRHVAYSHFYRNGGYVSRCIGTREAEVIPYEDGEKGVVCRNQNCRAQGPPANTSRKAIS